MSRARLSEEVADLMELQGVLRVTFMAAGVAPEKAGELAAEVLHACASSRVVSSAHQAAYGQLMEDER